MEWKLIKPIKKQKKGKLIPLDLSGYSDYKIPKRYVPIKYLDAFNIFFKFENFLRIFVYYVLKANLGKAWILDDLIRIIFKIVNFCYTIMYEKVGHGLMSLESKIKW